MRRRTQMAIGLGAVLAVALPFWRSRGAEAPVTGERRGALGIPTVVDWADTSDGEPPAAARNRAVVIPPSPETLGTWFHELPRAEDLPEDVHFAPPGIARAGEHFGAIVEAVRANPSYRDEAARFFGRCVEDTTVLDGIRSLCLHNWRDFRPSEDAPEPRADVRIRRIADFLPKNPRP